MIKIALLKCLITVLLVLTKVTFEFSISSADKYGNARLNQVTNSVSELNLNYELNLCQSLSC